MNCGLIEIRCAVRYVSVNESIKCTFCTSSSLWQNLCYIIIDLLIQVSFLTISCRLRHIMYYYHVEKLYYW